MWRCREQVAPCLMSRATSPQPGTRFFGIITIPISLYRRGVVMIAARFPAAMDVPLSSLQRPPDRRSGVSRLQIAERVPANRMSVPVEFSGYVFVVQTVADRATVGAGSRVAAGEPLLYQRLHLRMGQSVAQLYRRVARYGRQNALLAAHSRRGASYSCNRLFERSGHVAVLGQRRDYAVYPEGVLAKWLHVETEDRKLLQGLC